MWISRKKYETLKYDYDKSMFKVSSLMSELCDKNLEINDLQIQLRTLQYKERYKTETDSLISKLAQEKAKAQDEEIERLKAMVPRKEILKSMEYSELYKYATEKLGMSQRYINELAEDKAELIREILDVEKRMTQI